MDHPVSEVASGVFRVRDTCNVYVIRAEPGIAAGDGPGDGLGGAPGGGDAAERTGIAIDVGSGVVLDHLVDMGIDRLTDVLMTHHHRDQGQGLPLAAAAGIRIHVPPVERELFAAVDEMWRTRPVVDDCDLRQDRFSLLEPVPVAGVVPEYRSRTYGGVTVLVLPTPGHTVGSVGYLVERDGMRLGSTGDLIHGPGTVWSLAATQWSYTEDEGPAMSVMSCYVLMDRRLGRLLPSHGEVMEDPQHSLGLLAHRLRAYVDSRRPCNPAEEAQKATVRPVLPSGWRAQPDDVVVALRGGGQADVDFEVAVGRSPQRRARVAVDVRIGDLHLGRHAEALVDVVDAG